MSDAASDTRSSLLDAAEELVLERGFTGATVDAIAARAGVSKGAFFHHFSSKVELGRTLVERHGERERSRMERGLERAAEVSGDPLVQVLVALTLMEEELRSPAAGGDASTPGSLLAAAVAQPGAVGESGLEAAREALDERRSLLAERLEAALRDHTPSGDADPAALAGTLDAVLEGGWLMGSLYREEDPSAVAADRLGHFRAYLEILFGVTSRGGADPGPGPG